MARSSKNPNQQQLKRKTEISTPIGFTEFDGSNLASAGLIAKLKSFLTEQLVHVTAVLTCCFLNDVYCTCIKYACLRCFDFD